jgi:3-dehydroquinate dehydratase / shikimate dehydrogenase
MLALGCCNNVVLQVADKFLKFLSGRKPETCKLIVSFHNYECTPSGEELLSLVDQIQATGADIVKIATAATEIDDVSRMFQVLVHCKVSLPFDYTQILSMLVA